MTSNGISHNAVDTYGVALGLSHCPPSLSHLQHPLIIITTTPIISSNRCRTRVRASMDPPASTPAVAGFPYLPPSHRDIMVDLLSSIEARLGPTLLPSAVPPDVLCFENQQETLYGTLDIRFGALNSLTYTQLVAWFL